MEASLQQPGVTSSFLQAVGQHKPSIEDSFLANDITLELKLIPRHASFYIDGVPHLDFDRLVRISVLPQAFKMYY